MTPILPPNGRVIACVVGLESYVRTSGIKPVDYARRDVEAFAEVLPVAFPGRTVEVMMRIDDEATLASLQNELPYNIAGLHEDDLFVFYYAGHGFYGEGGNRLTAYDSNTVNLEETTWLLRELLTDPLDRSPCRRALVFIDACAKKLEAPGRSIVRPIDRKELDALATARFHAVFLSCEPGQTSYGSAELQHGIWTHFLLKALRGEAIDERLFKLEAIRLASVARKPALSKDDAPPTPPLQCVDRVRDLVLLAVRLGTDASGSDSNSTCMAAVPGRERFPSSSWTRNPFATGGQPWRPRIGSSSRRYSFPTGRTRTRHVAA